MLLYLLLQTLLLEEWLSKANSADASGWIDCTFSPPLLKKGDVSYIMTEPLDGLPRRR